MTEAFSLASCFLTSNYRKYMKWSAHKRWALSDSIPAVWLIYFFFREKGRDAAVIIWPIFLLIFILKPYNSFFCIHGVVNSDWSSAYICIWAFPAIPMIKFIYSSMWGWVKSENLLGHMFSSFVTVLIVSIYWTQLCLWTDWRDN